MAGFLKSFSRKPQVNSEQYSTTDWFNLLRQKWGEVPGAVSDRVKTDTLIDLEDELLVSMWSEIRERDTTGDRFNVRGWYHLLYKDFLRNKKVMDFGSGLGIDGITFAQHGAHVTFVDIVENNLKVLQRLCKILNVTNVEFCYLEDIDSLSVLPRTWQQFHSLFF